MPGPSILGWRVGSIGALLPFLLGATSVEDRVTQAETQVFQKPAEGRQLAEGLLAEHRTDVPPRELARLESVVGVAELLEHRPGSAAEHLERAVGYARTAGARFEEAEAQLSLGTARVFEGDYERGTEALRASATAAEASGHEELVARALNRLASMYEELGDDAQALEMLTQASKRDLSSDRKALGVYHTNYAAVLTHLGRTDEALPHFEEAARLSQRAPAFTRALVDALWSEALIESERIDEGVRRAQAALQLGVESKDDRSQIQAASALARGHSLQGRATDARRDGQAAVGAAERLASASGSGGGPPPAYFINTHLVLALTSAASGDVRGAWSEFDAAERVRRSAFAADRLRAIERNRARFDVERARHATELAQREAEIGRLQLNRQRLLGGGLALAALLVGTLAAVLWRNLRLQRRSNQLLDEQRAVLARQASALEATNAKILGALDQREVQLHEAHHRVKNNLQLVSSLIGIQARRLDGNAGDGVRVLSDMRNRIRTMALVHEKLSGPGVGGELDVHDYLRDLVGYLSESNGGHVSLTVHAPGPLPATSVVPLGLIVCELVTNAFEHAFPPGQPPGRVSVRLDVDGEALRLEVADDGRGLLPEESRSRSSLGLRLVHDLARQMDARLSSRVDHGTRWVLERGAAAVEVRRAG